MRIHTFALGLAAGLALAACGDVRTQSGPPVAGTATGPGASPLRQQSRSIGGSGSPNASPGTPTITGTRDTGSGTRPSVEYSGSGGTIGSPTPGVITGTRTSGGGTVPTTDYPSRGTTGTQAPAR